MNILFGLRKKFNSASTKSKAIAFIDYEHWFFSLNNLYGMKPDIRAWYNEISEKYDIKEIYFFGDFSKPYLRAEISKIREISSLIIETQNTSARHKKDYTDFIMLDHIYQSATGKPEIKTFIIFTGDGHFSSVVSYLTAKCRKEVAIYAVREALSTQLKNSATYHFTLPDTEQYTQNVKRRIVNAVNELYIRHRSPRPTFNATVDAISKSDGIPLESVSDAMRELLDSGCLFQRRVKMKDNKVIKVLTVNRTVAKAQGYLS
ncbi:MAG: NYN domain-containing protein [Clostridia bacterium]|nr:NYN domain-containing protein [Clostridia bacterium]